MERIEMGRRVRMRAELILSAEREARREVTWSRALADGGWLPKVD